MDDCNHNLVLRKVKNNDELLLYNWANDTDVRKWSFNNDPISLDKHKIWFKEKLDNLNILILILENNNLPSGMVRLEKQDKKVFLNYLIASESRGRGLASKMLKMAMNCANNHWNNIKVFAYTFPNNIASIKSLEKAGFTLESSSNSGKHCYVYYPKP